MFSRIHFFLSRFNVTGNAEQLSKDLDNYTAFAEMLAWD